MPGRKAGDPTVVGLKYLPSGEIQWKLRCADDWHQQLPSRRNPQKSTNLDQLKPLYDSPLKITSDKFKDLQFLKQVILPDYHAFLARDSIYAIVRYMPSPVRPSVCPSVPLSVPLSVTRVDQSKTFEVRITQLSPQSSPMTLVS